jgi:hypothetical protein
MAGVSTCAAQAAKPVNADAAKASLKVQQQTQLADKQNNKESACGKGSCGVDESGAKAAQEKHAAKETKKQPAKKNTKPAAETKKK